MDEALRKRLEEAASQYVTTLDYEEIENHIPVYLETQVIDAFEDGAEHGYKEAVKVAKEWLEKHGKLDKLDLVEFDMGMEKLFGED